MVELSEAGARVHNRLVTEFPFFAKHILKIRDKKGVLLPLILNPVQIYIHTKLEAQIASRGFVRALILKGRKQGCSTQIGGRFYHKAITQEGRAVTILTHDSQTTKTLFDLTKRYYDYSPKHFQPPLDTRNRNELRFSDLDSFYTVGTAGNAEVGRGSTPLLLHLSEIAFFSHTDQIRSGIVNAVPREVGTEIIAESTANGQKGMFYEMCMGALDGKGDYELIFIPWYWQKEYRAELPMPKEDYVKTITSEEELLIESYKLDFNQIHWRRLQISTLGSERLFFQEYPNHIEEAFQMSGNALVDPTLVQKAVNFTIEDNDPVYASFPLILGVDPARSGDRTALVLRQGRKLRKIWVYDIMDEMALAGIVANLIKELNIFKVFIDTGLGYGTIDRLKELGFGRVVSGVHFGSSSSKPELHLNKRAEMYIAVRDWFNQGGVDIPDDRELRADLAIIPDFDRSTSTGKISFMSKKQIRADYKKSPDIFDALALTFAFPVNNVSRETYNSINYRKPTIYTDSTFSTRSRLKNKSKIRIIGGTNGY